MKSQGEVEVMMSPEVSSEIIMESDMNVLDAEMLY